MNLFFLANSQAYSALRIRSIQGAKAGQATEPTKKFKMQGRRKTYLHIG